MKYVVLKKANGEVRGHVRTRLGHAEWVSPYKRTLQLHRKVGKVKSKSQILRMYKNAINSGNRSLVNAIKQKAATLGISRRELVGQL
jgi:hypothetical protein